LPTFRSEDLGEGIVVVAARGVYGNTRGLVDYDQAFVFVDYTDGE
jgi:hypothetical protein